MLKDKFGKEIKVGNIVLFASVSSMLIGKVLGFETNTDKEEEVSIVALLDSFKGNEKAEEMYKYPEKLVVIDDSLLSSEYQKLIKKVLK